MISEPMAGDRRPIDLTQIDNAALPSMLTMDNAKQHHRSISSLNQFEVEVDVHHQPNTSLLPSPLDLGRTRYLKDLKLSLFKDKQSNSIKNVDDYSHYPKYANTTGRTVRKTNSTTSGVSSTSPSSSSSSSTSTSPSSTATRNNNREDSKKEHRVSKPRDLLFVLFQAQ